MKRLVCILLTILIMLSFCSCTGDLKTLKLHSEEHSLSETDLTLIAESLMADMSLEQKIAQMLLVSCHTHGTAERAAEFSAGGLCLYSDAFEGKTADEVRSMTSSLQALSSTPLIISTDEEGGSVIRLSRNTLLREAPFLSPSELYDKGGFELIDRDTVEKAELLISLGINTNLAPVCDVPLDSSDYIFDRCFSTDAWETSEYISHVVSVMKQHNLGSVLKHFPGYGGSGDTHTGAAYDLRDYSSFKNKDFQPFIAGIESGADAVLVSHNIVSCMDAENPASLSQEVHRILRKDLHFDGVILTDDLVMGAVSQNFSLKNAVIAAVLAGNDMICCDDFKEASAAIAEAVSNGTVPLSRIDASVLRILKWKINIGII